MVVWATSHLCHNLRALVLSIRPVDLIAEVFHATNSVEYVILLVDSTSHIALVLCTHALSTSVRELVCYGPAWSLGPQC